MTHRTHLPKPSGEACLAVGKNAGRRLRDLVETDADYLRWIITKDFSAEVKKVVDDALHGRFPSRQG